MINTRVEELFKETEAELIPIFNTADKISLTVSERVLNAFKENHVGVMHLNPSTGYGYDDASRDTLDRVFAASLQTEDAIVRPQIASGTHALSLMLFGITKPGDKILIISGEPYDTIHGVFGLQEKTVPHNLKSLSIQTQIFPLSDGLIDLDHLYDEVSSYHPDVIYIQRSRGYSWRNALTLDNIQKAVSIIRNVSDKIIIALDNCYGEFTQINEPSYFGIDIMAGSLIKNPGGGIAPTGGYIAGKADLIELVSNRLTVPGIGREIGSYAASYIPFYQGLFLAPHVVSQSKKIAILMSAIFEKIGFETLPKKDDIRNDIVQSVRFKTSEQLVSFCKNVQTYSPIDSYVTPEPADMPGYSDQVIMAAGTFIQGASIEWSADGPIRPPYTCYIQGGLTYEHGRIAFINTINNMYEDGLVHF